MVPLIINRALKNIYKIYFLSLLLSVVKVYSQTPILSFTKTSQDLVSVQLGTPFSISGTITNDANGSAIPAGTPINYSITLSDPNGNELDKYDGIYLDGLGLGGNFEIDNNIFTLSWSEGNKWANASTTWEVSIQVSSAGASFVAQPDNSDDFTLELADLVVNATDPISPNIARPGEYIDITGSILNNSLTAQSEPAQFFRIDATIPGQRPVSTIFPTQELVASMPQWPIQANTALDFNISNVFIPTSIVGDDINVTITIDPVGNVFESNRANNTFTHNIVIDRGQAEASFRAEIDFDSSQTLHGLDPVRFRVIFKNTGTGIVSNLDDFSTYVCLSKDKRITSDDFLLRRIDFGGGPNALGLNLEVNGTVTVDWVQQLPDNFEGDYYLLITDPFGTNYFVSETPEISIRSFNKGDISLISDDTKPYEFLPLDFDFSESNNRPSTNLNGDIVAFEAFYNGVNQIFVKIISTNELILASRPFDYTVATNTPPNGSSYAPKISADGRFVVFHSRASNLVPDDFNNHADIFIFDLESLNSVASGLGTENVNIGKLTKISNSATGEGGNGGSFYPAISKNGEFIVFESEATNLDSNVTSLGNRQIFKFDHNLGTGLGTIKQITNGNAWSFDADIDQTGTKIVFTTEATDLKLNNFYDDNNVSDVILWNADTFYLAGRTNLGELPKYGNTLQPVISLDGTTIAFQSSASNMVSAKGIAEVEILKSGLSYTVGTEIQITDSNGSGAVLQPNLNAYGEIVDVEILSPGFGYVDPTIKVVPDSSSPSPSKLASLNARLVHRGGDIFRINVDAILNGAKDSKFGSIRVSETQPTYGVNGSQTGGDERSREPSIDMNGTSIAYSTLASNLLPKQLIASNHQSFPNSSFRSATAEAVLYSGIGNIQILNGGFGYPVNGDLLVEDLSGSGSGAVVSYLADSQGQIVTIIIHNPGANYDLSRTIVSVQNAVNGSGFAAGTIDMDHRSGASVYRIRMTDSGIGYSYESETYTGELEFIIDGDGDDLDGDFRPDAKIDSDLIKFGLNGEVYLEQHIDIEVISPSSLLGETLTISDANREIILDFGNISSPPFTVGVDLNSSAMKTQIIKYINQQWTNPDTNKSILEAPQISDNISGTGLFTIQALNGNVISSLPSALKATFKSNMLIQGAGFSNATVRISPTPIIYGFSEVESVTGSTQFQKDLSTDDIYVYDHNTKFNHRISLSRYGFPSNYNFIDEMPSHRFPSISGNGRYVFFSSDSEGIAGLIHGVSNLQTPQNIPDGRDILMRDLKVNAFSEPYGNIILNNIIFDQTNYEIPVGQKMPVMFDVNLRNGFIKKASLYVDNQMFDFSSTSGVSKSQSFILEYSSQRIGMETIQIIVEDNFGNKYHSKKFNVKVKEKDPDVFSVELMTNPVVEEEPIFIIQRTLFWHILADEVMNVTLFRGLNDDENESTDSNVSFSGEAGVVTIPVFRLTNENPDPILGPFTEAQIALLRVANDPQASNYNDAYYESDSPLNHRPLRELWPSRTRLTRGSVLNASAEFTNVNGRRSDIKEVNFFLNGSYIGSDKKPPYNINFRPESFNDNNLTVLNDWVLSVQGVSMNGASIMAQTIGTIDHVTLYPEAQLSISEETILQPDGTVYDNQEVLVEVSLSGAPNILENANTGYFLANGILIAKVEPAFTVTNSGMIDAVDYFASFNADFQRYAEADGNISVEFFGTLKTIQSHVPTFISNTLKMTVNTPMPWVDDKSIALEIFSDMDDTNITTEEIELFESISETSETPVVDWTEFLMERNEFKYRIDLVAANYVAMGDWHLNYLEYKDDYDDQKDVMLTNPMWLKSFIDSILTSEKYRRKFESVPYLVGSASSGRQISFGHNRRSFVERCLKNKYGEDPSFLQMNQGSVKMLNYWSSIEGNYWELDSNPDYDVPFDSPPRRDTIAPDFFGGGECAVELIYNLAKETETNGFSYITYTENYRETLFKQVAILISLWKKEAFPLDETILSSFTQKSLREIIEFAIQNYRYTSRFNDIWSNSDPIDNAPNWKSESWFGSFMDKFFPWVYHTDLKWIYIVGASPMEFWFYSEKVGWLWTGQTIYPHIYSHNENGWIYHHKDSSNYTVQSTGARGSF